MTERDHRLNTRDSRSLRRRVPKTVERCFSFVDLCGFTTFVEEHGLAEASEVLTLARSDIRILTSTYGVRVDKWLGDGALIVGTVTPSVLRAVLEIQGEVTGKGPLALRAGITAGSAMVFEGDDYIGSALNLAAKLCHLAKQGQVLVPIELAGAHRETVDVVAELTLDVPGIGPVEVAELKLAERTEEELRKAE